MSMLKFTYYSCPIFFIIGFMIFVISAMLNLDNDLIIIVIVSSLWMISIGFLLFVLHLESYYEIKNILCLVYDMSCIEITDEDVYNFDYTKYRQNYLWTLQDKWED